jgi:hypothetical protein
VRSGQNKSSSSRRPSDLAKKRKLAPAKRAVRSVSLKSEAWYQKATQAFGIRSAIDSPSIAPDGSATAD